MMVLFFVKYAAVATILTVIVFSSLMMVSAQTRSSSNYQLQSESINFAGGLSTSSNYTQESTLGEVGTGDGASASYELRAGYQQMQEVFISVSTPATVNLTGVLGGLTGGESNGSTTVTVTTDNPAGYQLFITAATAPAMQKGSDTIPDYVPNSVPTPDFLFETTSTEAHLGMTVTGSDVIARFRNNGSVCATGGISTPLRCWVGLTTADQLIAAGAGANHPAGATTTLQFRVGIGSQRVVPAGIYTATTTVTAIPQ
jgi:hypothetical protein